MILFLNRFDGSATTSFRFETSRRRCRVAVKEKNYRQMDGVKNENSQNEREPGENSKPTGRRRRVRMRDTCVRRAYEPTSERMCACVSYVCVNECVSGGAPDETVSGYHVLPRANATRDMYRQRFEIRILISALQRRIYYGRGWLTGLHSPLTCPEKTVFKSVAWHKYRMGRELYVKTWWNG